MTAVLVPAPATPVHTPVRRWIPLALIFLSVGLSTAMAFPFLTLFLTSEVHATPLRVTAFLIAAPLSSVLVSTLVGHVSDRWPIRRPLLLGAALAGCTGALLTSAVRDYWVLLGLTVTMTAAAGSILPQLFAHARTALHGSDRAAMTMSSLRTVFSLSWVAGPFLATVLLGLGRFALVYGFAATMYALAALLIWRLLPESAPPARPAPEPAPAPAAGVPAEPVAVAAVDVAVVRGSGGCASVAVPEPVAVAAVDVAVVRGSGGCAAVAVPEPDAVPDAPRRVIALTVAAFVLMQGAGNLGVQALPLFVTTDLRGDIGNAGLILGLCAGLEIPLMLGFGFLSTRVPLRRLILAGPLFSLAYMLTMASAERTWQVAAAQFFNAATVALVHGLGVSYVQEMLPRHPGRASTLFTNAFPAGAVLAGPILGAAQHLGYRTAYLAGAVLAVAALALFCTARVPRR